MRDGVLECCTVAWIFLRADTIVVTASVVSKMQSFEALGLPIVKLLRHVLVVDLVHNDIELMDFCEDAHFQLATPSAIFRDDSDVIVDIHVVFDE